MRVTKAYKANMDKLSSGGFDDVIKKGLKAGQYDFETCQDVMKAAKTAINKSVIYDRIVEVRAKKVEKVA